MSPRLARVPLAAMFVALAAAAPAAAQGSWQGIVTYSGLDKDSGQMIYYQGAGVARIEMVEGGEHNAVIIDPAHSTSTMIMPSRRMYMVNSDSHMADEAKKSLAKLKLTNTGHTEVIAGHTCTDYHAVDTESGEQSDACIATDMGTFVMLQQGAPGGEQSIWQRLFSSKGGFFPLKVVSYDKGGKSSDVMVATKIEAKSIDPSMFQPPAGYTKMDMGAMMHRSH